ncbi:hypothetical protein N836_20005 [Leptolyngbya sp. Heron Island J]|uniref:DUF6335 family protein n=1 Tax=Leptolyngbya sp. Heron Island J TaxID=1385935 RepID=UPI0003B969C5|nr:DUF6335 family protein [Leptolyngbya sp. Heron Island J]ESA33817.1 hypothetical protein N836_20005 [Leptolyngbya sp. Heron Island J]
MPYDDDQLPSKATNLPEDWDLDASVPPEESTQSTSKRIETDYISVEELTDRDTGFGSLLHQLRARSAEGTALTGGDMDTDQYQSQVSGEEAVGGTASTPEQNVVEDLAVAEGIQTPDEHPLRTLRIMQARDAHRWELEPESSEDYEEHGL